MKRKRTTRNSLRSSSSSSQQQTVPYLSDEYWELIFKHFLMDDEDYNSLSLVSKRFLSITNRFRSSLTIKSYDDLTTQQVLNLIRRFPNLTSLHLCGHQCGDLDKLLPQISTLTFNNLTSLKLSNLHTMPVNGLLDFSLNIKTLTSLTCSDTDYLTRTHMFLITDCFPNLQLLDFNRCHDISPRGIRRVLRKCRNITHLNLAGCPIALCRTMNFQVPKLEVLNLSYSMVNDQSLNFISNTCRGILQLLLESCHYVTHNGVNCVLQNCTQLREINLNGVKPNTIQFNVASMVLLRPSLTKITLPTGLCWVR